MRRKGILSNIGERPLLYLMVTPGIIYFILFFVIPILGNVIAWMDYNNILGFKASPWVGWKHFEKMFSYSEFPRILKNTIAIGFLKILIDFPVPIILALLLNEIHSRWFRKFSQTVVIIPYFLSWVIVARLVYSILHPDSGVVNILAQALGGESLFYMTKSELFPLIVVLAGSWQDAGYSCIVYLAALTTMDKSLFEAAEIDGANRWQQTRKITLPLLMP
ncbi:MAG: ABC transporter permease subunit, partial [Spirochaetaceae bacterium]|nr:ABC transporter permease subunit [Spirochaetaceae bacterium]